MKKILLIAISIIVFICVNEYAYGLEFDPVSSTPPSPCSPSGYNIDWGSQQEYRFKIPIEIDGNIRDEYFTAFYYIGKDNNSGEHYVQVTYIGVHSWYHGNFTTNEVLAAAYTVIVREHWDILSHDEECINFLGFSTGTCWEQIYPPVCCPGVEPPAIYVPCDGAGCCTQIFTICRNGNELDWSPIDFVDNPEPDEGDNNEPCIPEPDDIYHTQPSGLCFSVCDWVHFRDYRPTGVEIREDIVTVELDRNNNVILFHINPAVIEAALAIKVKVTNNYGNIYFELDEYSGSPIYTEPLPQGNYLYTVEIDNQLVNYGSAVMDAIP